VGCHHHEAHIRANGRGAKRGRDIRPFEQVCRQRDRASTAKTLDDSVEILLF
jgi:hypothetical protein